MSSTSIGLALGLALVTSGWSTQGQTLSSAPGPAAAAKQESQQPGSATVSATLIADAGGAGPHGDGAVTAVLWLEPIGNKPFTPFAPEAPGHYTLMQKNKMFSPHLLVVPLGSKVLFPNQDPFFHNVFSLFDGRRFDLGLYEAGKTKEITFSREGVSYIFCNIHSEMSAVIIALSSPLYSVADAKGKFALAGVPEGEYEMHIWAEGVPSATQTRWIRKVYISPASRNLGTFSVRLDREQQHSNKFGRPYDAVTPPRY